METNGWDYGSTFAIPLWVRALARLGLPSARRRLREAFVYGQNVYRKVTFVAEDGLLATTMVDEKTMRAILECYRREVEEAAGP